MRKRTGWIAAGAILALLLTACGNGVNTKGETESAAAESVEMQEESALAEEMTLEVPEGIIAVRAEEKPNEILRKTIIQEMEISEESLADTKYYYNYVDLNEDGIDEIFVMVAGPETSGTGGSSALCLAQETGGMSVIQEFTLINEPVIVSDEIVNGYHTLIVPYYGGDGERYSVLKYQDGAYPNVPDGEMAESLEGITGTAILANDRGAEMEAGIQWMNLAGE